ncbi:FAD-binding oxidoreductase [Hassallia byssoidea VB512170]|uniref:FAD-binding oxidoreductase n=1 Tax=Hassallia byssoidea VB512170 TaxID=1304833 RepID=A0A846H515_9CYAN|nr:FAD-binding oxidoreductase [Hassalia byssoidea]NEU72442.1 FAD-binding oxidoreductase [Hassalia byssoidea VB512170]
MKTYDWIVIGGGITGAALSYELRKKGFSVLLLEQNAIANNATRYSYGGLAYWSATTPLTRQLSTEAIARYHILSQELDADIEFRELNLLLTIPNNSDPQAIAALYTHVATPPKLLTIKEACELEPLLNPQAIAGALTVKLGHINPEKTVQAYIQAFLRAGGEIQFEQVLQILPHGVQTTTTTYHSANVVICAGGLSRQLLKSAGISIKLYFTHEEMIETPPVDVQLQTLIIPANLQRFKLEMKSTSVDELWDEPGNQIVPPILNAGAVQFVDGSVRFGQISRTLTDVNAKIDAKESEEWLRKSIGNVLPALENVAGTWHHCLVAFSNNSLPLIGAIPAFTNVHIFSGFRSPLVIVPPLAERFANFIAGAKDDIISQMSPQR